MHRLFLACPIPADAAKPLSTWATEHLHARALAPDHLHATLCFYPSVDDATRNRLADWTRSIRWEPLIVRVGRRLKTRGNAIAWRLDVDPGECAALRKRMLAEDDPLGMLTREQGEPEMERLRRRLRCEEFPRLHVTLARVAKGTSEVPIKAEAPRLAFILDRVALYESTLAAGGSRYTVIAEPA